MGRTVNILLGITQFLSEIHAYTWTVIKVQVKILHSKSVRIFAWIWSIYCASWSNYSNVKTSVFKVLGQHHNWLFSVTPVFLFEFYDLHL